MYGDLWPLVALRDPHSSSLKCCRISSRIMTGGRLAHLSDPNARAPAATRASARRHLDGVYWDGAATDVVVKCAAGLSSTPRSWCVTA
jgi:hypothetical protein